MLTICQIIKNKNSCSTTKFIYHIIILKSWILVFHTWRTTKSLLTYEYDTKIENVNQQITQTKPLKGCCSKW